MRKVEQEKPNRRRRENPNNAVTESGEGENQKESELRFYYTHENGPIHLTQKGFEEIKYDWGIARTISESRRSTGQMQDIFPDWAKYIPGLVETLVLLVKDESVHSKNLHSVLEEKGFMIDNLEEDAEAETPPRREETAGNPEDYPPFNLEDSLRDESKQILKEEGLNYNEDEYGSPEPEEQEEMAQRQRRRTGRPRRRPRIRPRPEPTDLSKNDSETEERERRQKEFRQIGNLEWGKNTETGWKVDYRGNLREVNERSESDIIVQTKERDSSERTRLLFECSVNHREAIMKLLDKYKKWTNETDETNVFIYVKDSPNNVLGHFSRESVRTSDWERDLSHALDEIAGEGSAMIKKRQEFVSDIINHARKDDDYEKNEGFRNTISIRFSS